MSKLDELLYPSAFSTRILTDLEPESASDELETKLLLVEPNSSVSSLIILWTPDESPPLNTPKEED